MTDDQFNSLMRAIANLGTALADMKEEHGERLTALEREVRRMGERLVMVEGRLALFEGRMGMMEERQVSLERAVNELGPERAAE